MNESDFWWRLEYQVCGEFAGLADQRYRYFWCDGFHPDAYELNDPEPQITGKAWIFNGPKPYEWKFALLLPDRVESRDEIKWDSLLPADGTTCWMSFDESRGYLEIEPAAAKPDMK